MKIKGSTYFDSMPLSIVYCYRTKPNIFFLRSQTVKIISEVQFTVFDLVGIRKKQDA